MIGVIVAGVLVGVLLWQVWSTWRRPRVRALTWGKPPYQRFVRFYPNFGFRVRKNSRPWSRHWGRR